MPFLEGGITMEKAFNYSGLFAQALSRIKSIRDPHSTRPETADLRWRDVASQVVFDFIDSDLRKYHNVAEAANEISISCLCFMIQELLKKYDYEIQTQAIKTDTIIGLKKARLCLFVKNNKTLLLIKDLEECAFWKSNIEEPKDVQDIMKSCGAESCQYIYLVKDNAFLQIVGHNNDENDPGRGYNVYSLKWFFENYFSSEEYTMFRNELDKYISDVHNCIGYNTVKTLTPGSLINFRKITENEIQKYFYDVLLEKQLKNYILEPEELDKIKKQFFQENTCQGLLGDNDFAESFLTAEWLYDSMKKAQAIDLTIIGMGYFKAIEQLLFELICLHKNEGRQIKKEYSRRDLPNLIELNDANIENESIDTTIGAMAVFYRDNLDIFREDLTWKTRKYILETIFEYKNLRNGYFHKNNIHNWEKIVTIRNATFELLFLLLGAIVLTEDNKVVLGFPLEIQSGFYKLCEYVHYHSGDLFYLDFDRKEAEIRWGCADVHSKVINDKYVAYSGVYFKEMKNNSRIVRFLPNNLPRKISLGKFVFGYSNKIDITPIKVRTIYENGKFVGPSIAEEEKLDY